MSSIYSDLPLTEATNPYYDGHGRPLDLLDQQAQVQLTAAPPAPPRPALAFSSTTLIALVRHGVVRVGDILVLDTAGYTRCHATITNVRPRTCYQDYQIVVLEANGTRVATMAYNLRGTRELKNAANALSAGLEAREGYSTIQVCRHGGNPGSLDYLRRVFDANRPRRV